MPQCAGRLISVKATDSPSGPTVITSLNLKGGVGKTHLCWLIAGVCQERGKKCLVVDLDKQGNLSTTLLGPDHRSASGAESFFDPAIDASIGDLIRKTPLSNIDCVPGSFALERFNMTAPGEWEGSGLELSLVDPLREVSPFYDYVLLDCPADISLITYAALCGSDFLMIPLESAHWGALGTPHVVTAFEHARTMHNSRLQLLGYVASRFRRGRIHQKEFLQSLREHYGEDAFETAIPDLAPFEKSVNDRIPIVLHSPSSDAANIARRFFDEVEARAERLRTISS